MMNNREEFLVVMDAVAQYVEGQEELVDELDPHHHGDELTAAERNLVAARKVLDRMQAAMAALAETH